MATANDPIVQAFLDSVDRIRATLVPYIKSTGARLAALEAEQVRVAHVLAAISSGGGTVPPPPPPPPGGFTSIANLVVAAHDGTHPVIVGVPLAPSVMTDVGAALLNAVTVAQVDNVSKDNAGWVRFFTLTAIIPTGTHTLSVSASAETAPSVTWSDDAPAAVVISNAVDTSNTPLTGASFLSTSATARGYWKQGPVVAERILHQFVGGSQFHCRFHVSKYANGLSRTEVIPHNGLSTVGGFAAPEAATYNVAISGPGSESFTGVKHHPHSRFVRRYGITPVHANVVPLGWGGSAEDGTWAYFKASMMFENFTREAPLASMTPITSTPDTPFAITSGSIPPTPPTSGAIGYFGQLQGAPGADPDIGPHPNYYMDGLRHFTANGKWMILFHADARQGAPYFWCDSVTKKLHRPDTGQDYQCGAFLSSADTPTATTIGAFSGTPLWNQNFDPSHWGASFYLPYLVSGELIYLEGQIMQSLVSWTTNYSNQLYSDAANGTQLTRHSANNYWTYNDRGSGYNLQWRTQGWAIRTSVHTQAIYPEDDTRMNALIGWDKTMIRTWWGNVQTHLKTRYVDTLTAAVAVPQSPSQYTSARFATAGPTGPVPSYGTIKTWMWAMAISSLHVGKEYGVLSSDGLAYYAWTARDPILAITSPTLAIPDFMMNGNRSMVKWDGPTAGWGFSDAPFNAGSGPAVTAADMYKASSQEVTTGGDGGYQSRSVDNPTAISVSVPGATEGTPVNFALTPGASGNCFPNPANYSFYVGTYILCNALAAGNPSQDWNYPTAMIIASITGPNSGTAIVTKDGHGNPGVLPNPILDVRLGWPHPADGRAAGNYPMMGEGDYIGWFYHLSVFFKDAGLPGGQTMYDFMLPYMISQGLLGANFNHYLTPR